MRLLVGLQYALVLIPTITATAIGLMADDPPLVAVALIWGVLSAIFVTLRIRKEGP